MKDQDALQRRANIATIAAGWTTVAALILGFITFFYTMAEQRKAADIQSDAAAVEILAKQYELSLGNAGDDEKKKLLSYFSLFAAETIYRRRPDDKGWRSSAARLIKEDFKEQKFRCPDFNEDFVRLAQETLNRNDVCE